MKMSVGDFKTRLLEAVLSLLWRQWTQLGVAGHVSTAGRYVIDPEALLVCTAHFGRYDQRLFDEVMNWLGVNQRFLNVQRLRVLSKQSTFSHHAVLGYMAATLKAGDASLKWRKLAEDWLPGGNCEPEGLFFLASGRRMPVPGAMDETALRYGFQRNPLLATGNSQSFPATVAATLLLQLRGLLGINARSEVMLALLTNDHGSIQQIADQSGFSWRSIQDVLFEMKHSNVVDATSAKKGRYYFLRNPKAMQELLIPQVSDLHFPDWMALYNAVAAIFGVLCLPQLHEVSDLAFQSVMQETLEQQVGCSLLNARFAEIKRLSWETLEDLPQIMEQIA